MLDTVNTTEIMSVHTGTAQSLVAGSTIDANDGEPYTPISSTGAITLTAQPLIAAGRNGQLIELKNVGAFNIIVQDVNALGGSLIRLTANTLTIQPGGTLALQYDSAIGFWIEQWLLNPQTFTPSVSGFTVDAAGSVNHEVGGASSAESPSTHDFAMTYIGTPSAASIDVSGGEIVGSDYPVTVLTPFLSLTGQPNIFRNTSVGSTRVWTVTATVAGTAGLTRTVTWTYINRRYCGPSNDGNALTSAQILGLDGAGGFSELSTASTNSSGFSVTTAAGEFIYYAHRSGYTTITHFSIDGELCAFTDHGLVSHTNDSGFVENFRHYMMTTVHPTGGAATLRAGTSYGAANFNNRIYMGPATDTDPISNANILALDDTADGESVLSSTVARTYTAIKIETGEYLWFCHPDAISDLATIKDAVTGVFIAGSYRTNVSHTNRFGYVETYRCWRSDNTAIFPVANDVVVT